MLEDAPKKEEKPEYIVVSDKLNIQPMVSD